MVFTWHEAVLCDFYVMFFLLRLDDDSTDVLGSLLSTVVGVVKHAGVDKLVRHQTSTSGR